MDRIRGKVILDYDHENDVLYSYINKPRPATSIETDNGIVYRVDRKVKKL